jgi:hypothetical protein
MKAISLMTKFLFIYRHTTASYNKDSSESMQQMYQKWQAWVAEGLQKGWMIDAGNGLSTEGCVVSAKKAVTDGPFIEAKEFVGGYAVVQADNLASAAEFAKGCPILLQGGSVEVRPFWK